MLRPRFVGSLILVYVLLFKSVGFLASVGAFRSGIHLDAIATLEVLLALAYLVGGIGLILKQRWAAKAVFVTAVVELGAIGASAIAGLHRDAIASFSIIARLFIYRLLDLVFPAAFAYISWKLQKDKDVWRLSQVSATAEIETERSGQPDMRLPVWQHRLFWAIVGTGLLLPSVMGLIVRNILVAQEKPVVALSEAVPWVIPATVLYAIPFLVLAFVGKSVLKRAFLEGSPNLGKIRFIFLAAFVGMVVSIAWSLYGLFQNMENMAFIFFAPYLPFFAALPGVVLGSLGGWIIFILRQQMKKSDP